MKLKKGEDRIVNGKKVPFIMMYEDIRIQIYKEVGSAAAMVYYTIRGFKKDFENMHCCYPSNPQIAEACGLKSTTSVQTHINTLKDKGWLKWNSGGSEKKTNNTYYFPREEYLYTEQELHYIAKVESLTYDIDKTTNKKTKKNKKASDSVIISNVEEIPTQDNNTVVEDDIIPVNDLFDEDIEEIIKVENNSFTGDDIVNDFYTNMHSYFYINDDSLKTNKTIIRKVNDLVEFINEEFVNNKIENVKAEKIINDIMKNNQKSFNNALNSKNITDDFKKCTYVISCVQNNFKDKKLKTIINNKADKFPSIDQSYVDGLNDYYADYISLSNRDNLSKKEAIRRIKIIIGKEEKFIKDIANDIVRKVAKFYNTTFNSFEECSMPMFKDIINELNKFYKREILMDDRFDGIIIQDIPDIAI